jgi:RNA polymerase sigma-70 factor (ECF subfamily)
VARNAVIDATRRSRRVTNVPLDENTEGPTSVHSWRAGDTSSESAGCNPKDVRLTGEPATDTEAIAAYLVTLLESLDESDREALRYVDLDNHSQRHFAQEHELGYATAKSRVQRARQRLRRSLEDHCSLELDGRGVPIACTPRKTGCCGS